MTVFNSKQYWEHRYKNNGNSGAGSYGDIAKFKAAVINTFISENKIQSAVELGCGDGNNLAMYNIDRYIGIDVSVTAVETCRKKHPHKIFYLDTEFPKHANAELGLSLDVVYHLVEDDIYHEYMKTLFAISTRFVIIFSTDKEETYVGGHVRHRSISKQIPKQWTLLKTINSPFPKHIAFSDFHIFKKQ